MEKLYVLAGKSGSGKDATTEILNEIYQDKKVINLSYGYYIKEYTKWITDWNGSENTKPRTQLQEVALEARKINPNFLIRRMEEDINNLKKYADILIINDARFQDEIIMPKQKFKEAITIRIERPNVETKLTQKEKDNLTETALDNYEGYDYIVINDSSLENLKNKIIEIVRKN